MSKKEIRQALAGLSREDWFYASKDKILYIGTPEACIKFMYTSIYRYFERIPQSVVVYPQGYKLLDRRQGNE